MTLTALASTGGGPTAAVTASAPAGSTISLPHTLYYLAADSAGLTQVFRIEKDGVTRRQVTSETS